MGFKGVRAADPSPEQIAEMTALIRRGWNKKEALKRGDKQPYTVPVLRPQSLLLERPIVQIY